MSKAKIKMPKLQKLPTQPEPITKSIRFKNPELVAKLEAEAKRTNDNFNNLCERIFALYFELND